MQPSGSYQAAGPKARWSAGASVARTAISASQSDLHRLYMAHCVAQRLRKKLRDAGRDAS